MAERRMFAKTIVLSDSFLDMPLGARCLYMTMGMLADDDGFVNAPKSIMRQTGATLDDMNVLIAKKFVIPFESGVIVIKHWRINNYLQKDRMQPTKYQDELAELTVEDNGAYSRNGCIHKPVYTSDVYTSSVYTGKDSIDKISIDKDSVGDKRKAKRFSPPTLEEVQAYCKERKNSVDAQRFIDYYTSNGWKVGKNAMKDWKAAVRTWEKDGFDAKKEEPKRETSYDLDEWEKVAMNFGEGE
jgi:hypothetical protein